MIDTLPKSSLAALQGLSIFDVCHEGGRLAMMGRVVDELRCSNPSGHGVLARYLTDELGQRIDVPTPTLDDKALVAALGRELTRLPVNLAYAAENSLKQSHPAPKLLRPRMGRRSYKWI